MFKAFTSGSRLLMSDMMRVILIGMILAAAAPSLPAADERTLHQKELADAFAQLDKVTAEHADDPAASRWINVGDVMSLESSNGSQLRLVAWNGKAPLKTLYGLTDGKLETPSLGGDVTRRFRVNGVWLSFDIACIAGARVLAPRNSAARSAMYGAVRAKTRLVVESTEGWTAEFDVRGRAFAEAVLRVIAVPRCPNKAGYPGPSPAIL